MTLPRLGVDPRSLPGFAGVVSPVRMKSKTVDKDLDTLLAGIEAAWRAQGHSNLRGLVFKGAREKGIIAESTWHNWRKGTASPDHLELRRVARAVGLDLGLVGQGALDPASDLRGNTQAGGAKLKRETQNVVRVMERVPDALREAIMNTVLDMVAENSNPLEAGEPQHSGPSTRST